MDRHVIAHGDGLARFAVNGAGVVAPLLDVGAESRLAQNRAHLVGDGDEQIAEDLEIHRVGFGPLHFFRFGIGVGATGASAGGSGSFNSPG